MPLRSMQSTFSSVSVDPGFLFLIRLHVFADDGPRGVYR